MQQGLFTGSTYTLHRWTLILNEMLKIKVHMCTSVVPAFFLLAVRKSGKRKKLGRLGTRLHVHSTLGLIPK